MASSNIACCCNFINKEQLQGVVTNPSITTTAPLPTVQPPTRTSGENTGIGLELPLVRQLYLAEAVLKTFYHCLILMY